MTEHCPLNTSKATSDGVVWEPYIPQDCWERCIKRALADPETHRTLEIYDGDDFEAEYGGKSIQEVYPESHAWGRNSGIKMLPNGQKVFIDETGPEICGEIVFVTATERTLLPCRSEV